MGYLEQGLNTQWITQVEKTWLVLSLSYPEIPCIGLYTGRLAKPFSDVGGRI